MEIKLSKLIQNRILRLDALYESNKSIDYLQRLAELHSWLPYILDIEKDLEDSEIRRSDLLSVIRKLNREKSKDINCTTCGDHGLCVIANIDNDCVNYSKWKY